MLKAYLELAKPERTLANVITALAGYLFASRWHIDWVVLAALIIGSTLIIASACVFNNCIDRDLDRSMKRTKKRVLVTGKVATRDAVIYATVLGLAGFYLLTYTNWLTLAVGATAFFSYVILYDLAKRYSVWGTLVGTVPGAASLVAGYTAFADRLDTAAGLLFLIMVCWQMAHFYAIAVYRLKDYRQARVPIWSVKYGIPSTKRQIYLFIVAFVTANALLWVDKYVGFVYLVVMSLAGAYWLLLGARGFDKSTNDDKWAHSLFGYSLIILFIFAGMLTVGAILP